MDFIPVAILATLVVKFTDFLKRLFSGDVNGVVTQLVVWGAGVAAVFLVSASQWAKDVQIGQLGLDTLGNWSLVLVGFCIGSAGSFVYDAKKALDGTDSAAEPPLLPPVVTARRTEPPTA
jgi:hypothetical protein